MTEKHSGIYVIDSEYNIISCNAETKAACPDLKAGNKCYDALMGKGSPCDDCPARNEVEKFPTPVSVYERRMRSLLDAFFTDYDYTYLLHLHDMSITAIKVEDYVEDISRGMEVTMDYQTLLRRYIQGNVHPDDQEFMLEYLKLDNVIEKLQTTSSFKIHYRIFRNNEVGYCYLKIAKIGNGDEIEDIAYGFASEDEKEIIRNKAHELKQTLKEVQKDALTGLYSQAAFYFHGKKLMESNPLDDYELILGKISNLSTINHELGREVGNQLLRSMGGILGKFSNPGNCIGYLGTGQFLTLCKMKEAFQVKGRVREFENCISEESGIQGVKLKCAVVKRLDGSISLEEAVEKAGIALGSIRYDLSQNYVEYDDDILRQYLFEEELNEDFEQALKNGEIHLVYQPRVDCETKKVIGAEALSRWIKPDGTVISPLQFIPVLEKSRRVYMLDEYVFREVCKLQKRLKEEGKELIPISVNLSKTSMYSKEAIYRYTSILNEYELDAKWVPLEITESSTTDAAEVKSIADLFTGNGFIFYMDDFGAGTSSLSNLQVISFDTIKFDKSLTDYIGTKSGESLFRHTMAFAKEIGMHVVAEGVETKEQYDYLKSIGCESIQGYYFSRPVPLAPFCDLLQ